LEVGGTLRFRLEATELSSLELRVMSSRSLRSAQARKRVPSLATPSLGQDATLSLIVRGREQERLIRKLENWKIRELVKFVEVVRSRGQKTESNWNRGWPPARRAYAPE
jgi:hypothetical protein